MLYHVYEMHHAAMAPMRLFATSALRALESPFNPFRPAPINQFAVATLDNFEHNTRRFGKPEFGHRTTLIDGVEVDVVEQIVETRPWGDLKRFTRLTNRPADPKLLIVAPMSGHYATLLRGTVEAFLPDHDVYITDWRDARDVPFLAPSFDLNDYIDYMQDFLRLLGPETHVIAVCQPAVPVLAAVSLMNANEPFAAPRSMTLIGGPIDTREAPTQVNTFAKTRSLDWFKSHVIHHVPFGNPGFMRKVYPGFLQLAGFMAMNLEKHVQAHWEMFQHLVEGDGEPLASKRAFYEEYRAVMDLSAEFYLQTIDQVFQQHVLPRGLMVHRGQTVEIGAVEHTAMFTIEGERDDISGIGQTKAAHPLAHRLAADKHAHLEQQGVGHYGLFNGKRFRTEVAPAIKRFIETHR